MTERAHRHVSHCVAKFGFQAFQRQHACPRAYPPICLLQHDDICIDFAQDINNPVRIASPIEPDAGERLGDAALRAMARQYPASEREMTGIPVSRSSARACVSTRAG